ncbi:MAG: MarR family winged helix-turn-helix transcriptional regulator [Gemmatimonadota bacterium]|nr:MarR family winged helix-turn-helix transcriptional regulator [Gemmatimonadota bacterium]
MSEAESSADDVRVFAATGPPRPTGDDRRRAALAERLNTATLRLARLIRREDAGLGETPARLSVVSTLVNRGPSTLADLAELEQVTPPTLTRLVQGLERDGYVIRRAAPHDARVSLVASTGRGWKLLEDIRGRRLGALRAGLAGLEPAELRTLEEAAVLMERLARG